MSDAKSRLFRIGEARIGTHIAIATGIATGMSLVSARLTAAALVIWIGVVVAEAVRGARLADIVPQLSAVSMTLAAFVAFAFARTLWAAEGSAAIGKLATFGLIMLSAVAVSNWMLTTDRSTARSAATGLAIGFCVGLAFLTIELASGQAIQIAVYNILDLPRSWMQPERHFFWQGDTLVGIELAHINRSVAVAAMLAFPAALAIYAIRRNALTAALAAAIVPLTGVAGSISRHESSMAALAIGFVIFLIAWMSRRWAGRIIAAGWVFAIVAVVPLALLGGRGQLDRIPWLHHSLAHRFIIWNYTAEETLKSPIVGIGAYMTYVLGPERNSKAVREEGSPYKRTLSRHAHNVFLQTWYELGAVGAALLGLAGLALLGAVRRLSDPAQPFALASFATGATMMSSSYGMWQTWYMALFALVAVALTASVRAMDNERGRQE